MSRTRTESRSPRPRTEWRPDASVEKKGRKQKKRLTELLRMDPVSRERRRKGALYRAPREERDGAGHVPRPTSKWGGGFGGVPPPIADEMQHAQAEADKQGRERG